MKVLIWMIFLFIIFLIGCIYWELNRLMQKVWILKSDKWLVHSQNILKNGLKIRNANKFIYLKSKNKVYIISSLWHHSKRHLLLSSSTSRSPPDAKK